MSSGGRPLISVGAAAGLAGVSRSMAYAWARSGRFPGLVEVNGRYYVRRAAFERWLDGADLSAENAIARAGTLAPATTEAGSGRAGSPERP